MKRTALCAAAVAGMLAGGVAQADGVPGQGTWETTLQPRDIDGDTVTDAFYDTALDITWLRNANGPTNWHDAMTWANTLVVGAVGGWRLPTVVDAYAYCDTSLGGGTNCGYNVDTASSEIAHLYYVTLDNLAFCPPGDEGCAGGPQSGFGLINTGGLQNLQGSLWSDTPYAGSDLRAWMLYSDGYQSFTSKGDLLNSLAVRPGDVSAVPEPQTCAMLLLGLSALMVALRRRPH